MDWTQPTFAAIASLVSQRTGLAFANRTETVELGIRRAMDRAGVQDLEHYVQQLAGNNRLLDDLVSDLTVGETYFFREPAQFDLIRDEILPDIRRRRGEDHVIRAWSNGCASGEEAYSLAILFHEAGLADKTHVLATDISLSGLAKARRAVYGDWSLRGDRASAVLPYLTKTAKVYRLHEKIRRLVTFEQLNLSRDIYPSPANDTCNLDLILCRNVLIYLDRNTVQRVAGCMFRVLAEGGWLIIASSDPPLWEHAPFQVLTTAAGLCYRRPVAEQGSLAQPGFVQVEEKIQEIPGDLQEFTQAEQKGAWSPKGVGPSEKEEWFQDLVVPPVSEKREPVPLSEVACPADKVAEARQALLRGDYSLAVHLTRDLLEDVQAAAVQVRALANLDLEQAEAKCRALAGRFPLSPELNFLHGVLLLDLGRVEEAIAAVKRVIYLDRSLAIAHFTLGSLYRRHGDVANARRAYRNARDICTRRPPGEVVPLADGESAGRLAEVAKTELMLLESS